MNLENKIVVISGGASGLGLATARYMVRQKGAKVALLDMNQDAGAAAVEELGDDNALFCLTDVTSEADVDKAVEAIMVKFGAIHADVNAAGIVAPAKILDRDGKASSVENFKAVINVNLIGLYTVMAKCAEKMSLNEPDEKGERGVIVNVSSGAAWEGQIGQSAYGASKSGVNGINIPAAREFGARGIRVNSIAPGMFATPMVNALDPKVKDALIAMCEAPKRMGEVDEFASTCAFLIENSYMNGRYIRLDAATILQSK
ncbi:SDR family NAD(P)-dependent oxidoreductase [uncultured Marinobacter sp.]|jgi:NAD(P)-dependent dehydrogenase (short-subunit alcohol dehydrogenase family)|uniref:SDR family NAD(P)-dependent oxidoreductase n=1 Tax=uncultured Marinobacter sp. TaxID=187379 RepID=UPI0030DC5445|tara:strand:- start:4196 stop:4972 length:777 start_codon:yes stop_codon:yes gene_type:complete